ncbi:hypothetical protein KPB05_38020 [Burkholderia gladioli]|uniref:hypothetical protein n=1 Tax=Burkholderia gladioli TaxID=28095 RepID=UPI0028551F91|nr:hypothetical protein [Burkholderia gladioli]MDR8093259.1 hypothetical protein [Burkholderia gladioli]
MSVALHLASTAAEAVAAVSSVGKAAGIAASSTSASIGDKVSGGLWSFCGGLIGAVVALLLAYIQGGRERLKMAADSAGSHMANVAFDKYVQFCEGYMEVTNRTLALLFSKGPTSDVLAMVKEISVLRRKWALWVTTDTAIKLDAFEDALREIGSSAGYVESARTDPHAIDHAEHVERMYSRLSEVMGYKEWRGKPLNGDNAVQSIEAALRTWLGTDQLDMVRRAAIDRAIREFAVRNRKI